MLFAEDWRRWLFSQRQADLAASGGLPVQGAFEGSHR
jgi:hypothetical protein